MIFTDNTNTQLQEYVSMKAFEKETGFTRPTVYRMIKDGRVRKKGNDELYLVDGLNERIRQDGLHLLDLQDVGELGYVMKTLSEGYLYDTKWLLDQIRVLFNVYQKRPDQTLLSIKQDVVDHLINICMSMINNDKTIFNDIKLVDSFRTKNKYQIGILLNKYLPKHTEVDDFLAATCNLSNMDYSQNSIYDHIINALDGSNNQTGKFYLNGLFYFIIYLNFHTDIFKSEESLNNEMMPLLGLLLDLMYQHIEKLQTSVLDYYRYLQTLTTLTLDLHLSGVYKLN